MQTILVMDDERNIVELARLSVSREEYKSLAEHREIVLTREQLS